jgi:phage tail-like protein
VYSLRASTSARGGRVELGLQQRAPTSSLPRVVLVRRRGAYPSSPDDGLAILDSAELFDGTGTLWERRERWRFVLTNAPTEGGLRQLELVLHFAAGVGPDAASRARVVFYDGAGDIAQIVAGVASVERRLGGAPSDPSQLRLLDAAGAELASLSWSPTAPGPGRVTWIYPSAAIDPVDLAYHLPIYERLDGASETIASEARHDLSWKREGQRGAQLELRLTERTSEDTGIRSRDFELYDRIPVTPSATIAELQPEQHYYYQGFTEREGTLLPEPSLTASVVATARYGFASDPDRPVDAQHRLYELLPAVLKRLDEPSESDRLHGPLRAFLEAFGAGFDELRSRAETLRHRHDLREVRSDLLPRLARYIGWDLDIAQSALGQRLDIAFAPELYRSVGTLPGLKALVTRASGLDVRFKEFVHNVAFTNAPESPRLWELWERRQSGGTWSAEQPVTTTTGFHGRPALAFDTLGQSWVFAHEQRDGKWSVFAQRIDPTAGPRRELSSSVSEIDPCVVATGTPDEVFVFTAAQRADGGKDLVVRRVRLTDAGAVVLPRTDDPARDTYRVTDHPAVDRFPAAARAGTDIWLFWQSSRSGRRAIWGRRLVGENPSGWTTAPERLTDGEQPDETPAAAFDATTGRLHLAWSRDHGDRSAVWHRIHAGVAWLAPQRVGNPDVPPPPFRDRSPALGFAATGMVLCFHSDRPHPIHADAKQSWRIWRLPLDGASPAELVVDGHGSHQEPALAVASDGTERLVYRSQRRGRELYWTRTVDTTDSSLLADMGTYDDRVHYTYDTERENHDWFAGNAVGLFFSSTTASSSEVQRRVDRMRLFVEPFRPEHVRLVWIIPLSTTTIDLGAGAIDRYTDRSLVWMHTVDTEPVEPRFVERRVVDTEADPLELRYRIVDADLERLSRS